MSKNEEINQTRPSLPNRATSRYGIARLVLADIDRGGVMSKEKFAQGEWAVKPQRNDIFIISKSTQDGGYVVCDIRNANKKDEANAHLISAAPDMYRALDVICKLDEHQVFTRDAWETALFDARKALAKARGEG